MLRHSYATYGTLFAVFALVAGGSCSTTSSAEAGTNGSKSSKKQSISASEMPIVRTVQDPSTDIPTEEIGCVREVNINNIMAANGLEAVDECHGELRRKAKKHDADYVMVTTQTTMCTGNVCNVVFVATTYKTTSDK